MWAKFVMSHNLNNICRNVDSISMMIVLIEIAIIILIRVLVYCIWRWESSTFFLFDATFDSQFSSWSFEWCHSLYVYCWLVDCIQFYMANTLSLSSIINDQIIIDLCDFIDRIDVCCEQLFHITHVFLIRQHALVVF